MSETISNAFKHKSFNVPEIEGQMYEYSEITHPFTPQCKEDDEIKIAFKFPPVDDKPKIIMP